MDDKPATTPTSQPDEDQKFAQHFAEILKRHPGNSRMIRDLIEVLEEIPAKLPSANG